MFDGCRVEGHDVDPVSVVVCFVSAQRHGVFNLLLRVDHCDAVVKGVDFSRQTHVDALDVAHALEKGAFLLAVETENAIAQHKHTLDCVMQTFPAGTQDHEIAVHFICARLGEGEGLSCPLVGALRLVQMHLQVLHYFMHILWVS